MTTSYSFIIVRTKTIRSIQRPLFIDTTLSMITDYQRDRSLTCDEWQKRFFSKTEVHFSTTLLVRFTVLLLFLLLLSYMPFLVTKWEGHFTKSETRGLTQSTNIVHYFRYPKIENLKQLTASTWVCVTIIHYSKYTSWNINNAVENFVCTQILSEKQINAGSVYHHEVFRYRPTNSAITTYFNPLEPWYRHLYTNYPQSSQFMYSNRS